MSMLLALAQHTYFDSYMEHWCLCNHCEVKIGSDQSLITSLLMRLWFTCVHIRVRAQVCTNMKMKSVVWTGKAFIFYVRFHLSFQNVIQINDKTEPKVPTYLSH